jgi:hypothetical protein
MLNESTNEPRRGNGGRRATRLGQKEIMLWVQERIRGLPFKLGMRQPADMPLGTRVLVLKGEARNDIGQMAIVTAIAGSQVEISYRGPTGQIKTRRKQRASLIRMAEGVELVVNAQGWPILQAVGKSDETSDNEGCGVVSADDDSVAE